MIRVQGFAESVFGAQLPLPPEGIELPTHPPEKCEGEDRPCLVHRPSDHHMRSWPLNWRADRNLMERWCPHGIGHPDPDEINPDTSHGCDGCCQPPRPELYLA